MRIGLALSGGGVRGLAHLGVIRALREHNIRISHFSGSSAGALVGVMAAADCSMEDMLDFWTETNPLSIRHFAFGEPALFHTLDNMDTLKKYVQVETFESLPHRLTVCATAMLSGQLRYFSTGPLWPIVLASASYPIVFSPVEWEDEIYMDGGIINNFPVEPLRDDCDIIIGVDVDPHRTITKEDLKTYSDIMVRVMDLRFQTEAGVQAQYCDVLIQPPNIHFYSAFQTGAMLEIFQLGYEAGLSALPEIRAKISEKRDG